METGENSECMDRTRRHCNVSCAMQVKYLTEKIYIRWMRLKMLRLCRDKTETWNLRQVKVSAAENCLVFLVSTHVIPKLERNV